MLRHLKRMWPLHAMLAPAVALTFVFAYLPMFGLVIAFQDYKPWYGFWRSPWVGFAHFEYLFSQEDSTRVIWNTLIISAMKLVANLLAPLVFALLLNEVRRVRFKRTVQTLVYLPHFLSWVILAGIMIDLLSLKGIVNRTLTALFGIEPVFFLGDGDWFRATVVLTDVWKEFGFGTILFLASLAGVNPALYEAAEIDGANRWKQTLYVTIPAITPITVVVATLSLGNILNAGFDQIFNLYNPLVFEKGDIIDTYVYRVGLLSGDFSFATAVGLFKSVVGLLLIAVSYRLAYRFANYRIF
ncbi:ABC transporter permease [Paenibacillus flagellatus]|uniref:Protein lplB n=1 Tax=Paenibacillus flagellatus TaxID=2211139 RepID=A0A2V5K5B8_9BACL|nr:ABC transporter permease subunit [Paenibacillus flagellatus]PYI52863.1 protein lplB [Paenibacillus flagellatus]